MSQNDLLSKIKVPDPESIEDMENILNELGVSELSSVDVAYGDYSSAEVRICDSKGRLFYIDLDILGYVECIRADSPDGTIIFEYFDD